MGGSEKGESDFEKSAHSGRTSLLVEFFHFLLHNKKWWLAPILVILFLVGVLIVLAGTGAAPFIYALF